MDTFHLVYEEKYISKYNLEPLMVVGCEGLFGLLIISSVQIPMYFCHTQTFQLGYNPTGRMVDPTGSPDLFSNFKLTIFVSAQDAIVQVKNSPPLLILQVVRMFSLGLSNFAGVSITKYLSSTTRNIGKLFCKQIFRKK